MRAAIDHWSRSLRGDIAVNVTSISRRASTAPFPGWLPKSVERALTSLGIASPYRHQVEAWEHLNSGDDVIVATETASGKTLCYNVPVLSTLARDPHARALYVFPTKALARDQEAAVRLLTSAASVNAPAMVYDGDTPGEVRRAARTEARIIITNPDMLHTGILPHHASWAAFFANLRYVVVDELHQYRGVFGSHVANVIRRLRRVADFHGCEPRFVSCSATIGNPEQLARGVIGSPASLVQKSGAPAGPRTFIVYNPEIIDPVMGIRKSALKTAARMAGDLVERGVVTLVFCQTRRGVEITLRYLRQKLTALNKNPERARGYRGGYLPTLRREIETALREGRLDAVVATNALELGIDVGELDAVILAGYPGTIAATHQRSGRAGRRQGPSLSVLVAGPSPLDQFLAREPSFLMDSSPEVALVQPDNLDILLDHLRCAAFEIPFEPSDSFGSLSVEDTGAILEALEEEGDLSRSGGRFHFVGDRYPAADVNLRSVGERRFVAVDTVTGEPLAEMDMIYARRELHEEAIYQHDGDTYLVEKLDLDTGRADVTAVDPVYYTTAVAQVGLEVVEVRQTRRLHESLVGYGDATVTEEITGYKKTRFRTHENLGYGPVSLPPYSMETEATWIPSPPGIAESWKPSALIAACEGTAAAIHQVASLRLMCDPRDLSSLVRPSPEGHGTPDAPAVYLYDAHAGGVGLCERAYEEIEAIVDDARRLVEGCPCVDGCPACVGPPLQGAPPIKALCSTLLDSLAGVPPGDS